MDEKDRMLFDPSGGDSRELPKRQEVIDLAEWEEERLAKESWAEMPVENGRGGGSGWRQGLRREKVKNRWLMLLVLLLAALLVVSAYQSYLRRQESRNLLTLAENSYQRDFLDLTQHLNDITGQLAQVLSCSSREQRVLSLSALWRQCFAAQANLGGLPLQMIPLTQTEKFLGDTADAAHYLLWRTAREEGDMHVAEQEYLMKLYERSRYLSENMEEISLSIVRQDLRLVDVQTAAWSEEPTDNMVLNGLDMMETALAEYPELNITGDLMPLAGMEMEHRGQPSAPREIQEAQQEQEGAEDSDTITEGHGYSAALTEEEADLATAAEPDIGSAKAVELALNFWLGGDILGFGGQVAYESVGDLPTYSIEISSNNGNIPIAVVDVVKKDGRVLWAMAIPGDQGDQGVVQNPPAYSDSQLIQGGQLALAFLQHRQFPPMALAYSQNEGGYGVYTLAPLQEGVRLYVDQIKIQVDLQRMEISGYEGTPFYRNHHQRQIGEVTITRNKLLNFISLYLKVEETQLALIQDDWGKEILTWEVRAAMGQEKFALFYNCATGAEEKILRLQSNI